MKNLSKIFMLIGFVAAALSMIISMIDNQSWIWQFNTMMWIAAAYMIEKTSDRYRRLIDKIVIDLRKILEE
jgi:hypothetical protein